MPKAIYGPIELEYKAVTPCDFIDQDGFVPLLFIQFKNEKNKQKEFWEIIEEEKENNGNNAELLKNIISKGVTHFNGEPFNADAFFKLSELVMTDGKPFIEIEFLFHLFALICKESCPYLYNYVIKNKVPMAIHATTAQYLDKQSIRYKQKPSDILLNGANCSSLDSYIIDTAIMMLASNDNMIELNKIAKNGGQISINYDISKGV